MSPAPPLDRARVLRRAVAAAGIGVAILALTGLSLGAAVSDRPPAALLAEVRWPWMAASTLFVLIGTGSHGARMRPLLPPAPPPARLPSRRSLGALYLAASVLNLSFPGPAGEIAAALALSRSHGLSPAAVLAASLHARFVALFVAAAGALSEIALAWQHGKPIVTLDLGEGWSSRLAGERLDHRRDDLLHRAEGAEEAVRLAVALVGSREASRGF